MANCPQCGNAIAPTDRFCAVCGRVVGGFDAPPNTTPVSSAVPSPMSPGMPPSTSGKAIASLICGVFLFILPASIAAVVLGHLSLSEIKKSAGRIQGKGLATAGLVLGYLGLAFIPILIIAAIAIPNLLRARIAANESSAVVSLRQINVAEVSYAHQHPEIGFTCDLNELSSTHGVEATLATGTKTGYTFSLQNCALGDAGTAAQKYQVLAVRLTPSTGRRTFCSDESGVIKSYLGQSAQDCLTNGQSL